MAAPTGDVVLPPLVFLMGLLTVFIVLTIAFAPTISSNLEADWTAEGAGARPEYLDAFHDGTYSTWTPNPYTLNPDNVTDTWPFDSDMQVRFTNPSEDAFWIQLNTFTGYWGGSKNLTAFRFFQWGGWLGIQQYEHIVLWPQDFTARYNSTDQTLSYYEAQVNLRHPYLFVLGGETEVTLDATIQNFTAEASLYHSLNATSSANPWVIVGQFFSFRLPGIPTWLNVLLVAPIALMIGISAFILIRGALPT